MANLIYYKKGELYGMQKNVFKMHITNFNKLFLIVIYLKFPSTDAICCG